MSKSLWLLMRLRIFGWFRKMGQALKSVKGILVGSIGFLIVISWLFSIALQGRTPNAGTLDNIRRIGPLALLGIFLMNLIFSTGEKALAFTPAEVNFLFSGPFNRRELLLFKIVNNFLAAFLTSIFMALMLRPYTSGYLCGWVGMLLALIFLQLFTISLGLIANIIGATAFDRRRKIVIGFLFAVVGISVFVFGKDLLQQPGPELLDKILDMPVVSVLLSPFRWLVLVATAEQLWPDFLLWTGLSLVSNLVMLGIVFSLDAHYLEAAADAGEKIYQRLQKVRRGGMTAAGPRSEKKGRLSIPGFPRLGGLGPLAWRQLISATRNLGWLVILGLYSGFVIVPMSFQEFTEMDSQLRILVVPAILIVLLSMFFPPMMTFDFRGDVDHMEVLKSLPIPTWRLVVGQILTPVVLLSLLEVALVSGGSLILGEFQPIWIILLPFLFVINFCIFSIENIFFLLFPYRLASNPGDFQLIGRMVILWLLKWIVLMIGLGMGFLVGAMAYFLFGGSWLAGGIVTWCVISCVAAALVPVLVLSFNRFDVSKDLPE